MNIVIGYNDWGYDPPDYCSLNKFGLVHIAYTHFKIIDEQLFLLAVVKYGIKFKEIDHNDAH